MNGQDSQAEIFDVFLCHNSEDKPAVREIAQKLSEENIKPWLDEADIRSGIFWDTAIGEQLETVKSAAVFIGQHGVGPWQRREIIALLDQFDRRGCPVIPVILASAPVETILPWSLLGLHCVDFRATNSHPLQRLIWGITDQKPAELSEVPFSEKPATTRAAAKCQLLPSGNEHAALQKVRSGDSRQYPPLAEEPDKEQKTQLEILRRRVKEYWVDGVLRHSLYNEVLISLGRRQVDEFVDAPWKYAVEISDGLNSTPLDNRDVNAIYDATGLLLILGEPGSGKTTTLLDLTRTLLERAKGDIKERVPVVVNLSTWKNRQPLVEWISGELSEKYRVPRKIARLWLQQKYLLPLLDGLDEIETSIQPDCVAAINAFIEDVNPPGLVVCCRLNEYRWLPKRLKLNGAIRLEPLSKDEVAEYFTKGGAELEGLRKAVNTHPVLQELTQTPLMLSVMSLAYQGLGDDELATQKEDSAQDRRKQIFRLYVEQMFRRKGTSSLLFPKEKTIGWLSWLAGKMREHSQSVFLVEGLQPSWLGTKAKRLTYGGVAALTLGFITTLIAALSGLRDWLAASIGLATFLGIGLGCWSGSPVKNGFKCGSIGGLIYGLISALAVTRLGLSGLSMALFYGLVAGLLYGVVIGLISGLGAGSLKYIASVEAVTWNWNQFWKRAIRAAIIGLIIGLIFWLIVALLAGLYDGVNEGLRLAANWPRFALGAALIFGIAGGLIGGFTDRVKSDKATPNQGITLSRKNSLVAFFVASLTSGLCVGLATALSGSLSVGLHVVLLVVLPVALIASLNRGGSAVVKHYALRLILWRSGYTPFNFIKFLDDCAKLIFLKKVGGGYIFIHRMLLDYFADLSTIEKSVESKRI